MISNNLNFSLISGADISSWIALCQMTLPISVEDVKREVKILRTLSGHENVVQFYASFEDDDLVYIVMEYVYRIPLESQTFVLFLESVHGFRVLPLFLHPNFEFLLFRLCEGGELLDRILAK
jgi:hypothetical protein